MSGDEEYREFPVVDVEDLQNLWRLGNLLHEWSKNPRDMDDARLAELTILSEQYGVNSTRALFAFQKDWQVEIDEATTARMVMPPMPTPPAYPAPYPAPHLQPGWALSQTIQQPILAVDPGQFAGTALVEPDPWVEPDSLDGYEDDDRQTGEPLAETEIVQMVDEAIGRQEDIDFLKELKTEPVLFTHEQDENWIDPAMTKIVEVPPEVLAEASDPKIARRKR